MMQILNLLGPRHPMFLKYLVLPPEQQTVPPIKPNRFSRYLDQNNS